MKINESKFTSGPWHIERGTNGKTIYAIGPCEGETHQGEGFLDVKEDDAHLIVASPDLYQMLEKIVLGVPVVLGREGFLSEAIDILAKARGET